MTNMRKIERLEEDARRERDTVASMPETGFRQKNGRILLFFQENFWRINDALQAANRAGDTVYQFALHPKLPSVARRARQAKEEEAERQLAALGL